MESNGGKQGMQDYSTTLLPPYALLFIVLDPKNSHRNAGVEGHDYSKNGGELEGVE